eukprot:g1658.t1
MFATNPVMHSFLTAGLFIFATFLASSSVLASKDIFWHAVEDYDDQPLLHGKAKLSDGEKPQNYFNRLPASASVRTRSAIWALQQQPAGMFVQFVSNTSSIDVSYSLGNRNLNMWHFAPTGVSGMDCYVYDEGNSTWRWTGTTRPTYPNTNYPIASVRCQAPNCPTNTFRIHLPPYNTVMNNFSIGVSSSYDTFIPDATHFQDPSQSSIVWYGSSILQGAVASRPGQMMTHQVSRSLETLIYNFGFSGNCLMELSVAEYLVKVDPPPSMFIIDCNPNMDYLLINERIIPLVTFIRKTHPSTPIILTEGTKHGEDWYSKTARVGRFNKTIVLKAAFDILVENGDKHLYYSTSQDIYSASLGMDPDISGDGRFLVDPTVGGTHPTDLGMRKQAKYWEKKIPEVFEADEKKKKTETMNSLLPHTTTTTRTTAEESGKSNTRAIPRTTAEESGKSDTRAIRSYPFSNSSTKIKSLPSSGLSINKDSTTTISWTDGVRFLEGRATFIDEEGNILPRTSPYDRLPTEAKEDVRDIVWSLSELSTGMYLRFTTNASRITMNHTLAYASEDLWLMPPSGTDGFDVYTWSPFDKRWRHIPAREGFLLFTGDNQINVSGSFDRPQPETQKADKIPSWWTYLIYLPLRNAPANITLGIPSDSSICGKNDATCSFDVAPRFDAKFKPIVWYGTSIQQGAAASRAGNEYDAIVSRALSVEIHNFGFAGNGIMELSVAKYLSMAEASIIVIDCLPNMQAANVSLKTIPLVKYLRKSRNHRYTPIILAEGTPYPGEWLNGPPYDDASKNAALRTAYDSLIADGVKNLHYVEGKNLFKSPLVNPTVGGVHGSDLGQYEITDYYAKYLPKILKKKQFTKY